MACVSAHSKHPSSKLCLNWLGHCMGTTYLSEAVRRLCQRLPKGLGTNVSFQCCFTSTDTIRLIRDGQLDFHTAPELWVLPRLWKRYTKEVGRLKCCFTSTETVGLLGTRAQDGHLNFHTAPALCHHGPVCSWVYSIETRTQTSGASAPGNRLVPSRLPRYWFYYYVLV